MRYRVEIKEDGRWVDQGDGPMGKATAERVAQEIRQDFKIPTRVVLCETEYLTVSRVIGRGR